MVMIALESNAALRLYGRFAGKKRDAFFKIFSYILLLLQLVGTLIGNVCKLPPSISTISMSIFDQLRRSKNITGYNETVARRGNTEFFFCMKPDKQGIYLEAVDKAGKETTFDYRQHSGMVRNIARNVQLIIDRNNFTVDWENPESRLYLHHPYLVPQLLTAHIVAEGYNPGLCIHHISYYLK